MKARKRYLLLFVAFLALIHFGLKDCFKKPQKDETFAQNFKNKTKTGNDFYDFDQTFAALPVQQWRGEETETNNCRMNTCFDLKRCSGVARSGLRIHLYPNSDSNGVKISENFAKILEIIRKSVYFEENPKKACLFVSTVWDPLDRDPLSRDFQKGSPSPAVDPLFGGTNHLVFNLYSGSWPHYRELDFGYHALSPIDAILKRAILVKASQSSSLYRPDFDVSLPLFARNHPLFGPQFTSHESQQNYFPTIEAKVSEERSLLVRKQKKNSKNKYLLVFKGKRYIYGIGSETRNSLHYLNNGQDVLILTTCRHGKKWKDMKDEKHDYASLMANSTFCLVPRGRRLGSYRFLEALAMGCIPVVLSNSWVLPFKEIIDWNACAVRADERLLLQIPEQLRSISDQKVLTMRHKCLALYEQYFSSVERIVMTSLLILEQRLNSHLARQHFLWNLVAPQMSAVVSQSQLGLRPSADLLLEDTFAPASSSGFGFTALIHVTKAVDLNQNLQKLVQKTLHNSRHLRQIVVLWSLPVPIPHFLIRGRSVRIIQTQSHNNMSNSGLRFDASLIGGLESSALFQLSPHSLLTTDEIEFAFSVWQSFPNRLIGFNSRDHYFSEEKHVFDYSSKWTNEYSILLSDSLLYHKLFHNLFTDYFLKTNNSFAHWIHDYDDECTDLAFAFLVAHITREGPIKVSQRKRTLTSRSDSWIAWSERRLCFERLQRLFGYLPLIQSRVRFDPVLYKDLVSIRRKKYRKMETLFK